MTGPVRRARVVAAALGVASILAAGCGIPEDGEPRSFRIGNFVSELEAAELEGRDPDDTLGTEAATIYLIQGDRLVERSRSVADNAPTDVITQLLFGPTEEELDSSIRSALSAGARLLGVTMDDGIATIDIGTPFTDVEQTYEIISALGQLVFTATGVPGVVAVKLALDGEIVPAPTESGETIRSPLTRADYDGLLGQQTEETG